MGIRQRVGIATGVLVAFGMASWVGLRFGTGGLWRGLDPALAVTAKTGTKAPYDLTRLEAVNETLKLIRNKYVDPGRVHPRDMLMAALNRVQQDVAQVIVLHKKGSDSVLVRVGAKEKKFRVDNIQGPWDVSARLGEVFAFLQANLRNSNVKLRDIEYAACNGMLQTLDPHSTFLSPEAYKEMNLSTSGAFGGLGIVISIRDQVLTVMRPMPDTPAGRKGLKRLDRITKIDSESTLNMPLDGAVRRLRGEPGTPVTIWVHRDGKGGWKGSRPFKLIRERIQVRSVESKQLDNGVGYIRLKQFQRSSSREVKMALAKFHKAGEVKGVVLDLRGNPGGLLDQAVRIADLWVDRGVLVSTRGAKEGRDEKRARRAGTEPPYPIVVLVNGSSASASEIVSGALKNLDRALIVGERTFGKGSVQLVFTDVTSQRAALKLTIAQYLTPGDISIQSVGIPPDIRLDPMTVDPLEMDLTIKKKGLREKDLSAHLSNKRVLKGQKPAYTIRHYLPEAKRAELRELGGNLDDGFKQDFAIGFAHKLIGKMPAGQGRKKQLKAVQSYALNLQNAEVEKAAKALKKLKVDWAPPPKTQKGKLAASDYEVKVTSSQPRDTVKAGESMSLKVVVTNKGKFPIYRLRAKTKSPNHNFNRKELVFGKIDPGKTVTATAAFGWCAKKGFKFGTTNKAPSNAPKECRIAKDAVTRQDGVTVKFFAEGGAPPAAQKLLATTEALPKPEFSYAYEVVDNRDGANGDGRLQKKEGATLYLTVKNVGAGATKEAQVNLRNLSGDGVLLNKGRFDISNMQPGEVRRMALTFNVLPSLKRGEVKLQLTIADRDLDAYASEKIKLPILAPLAIEAGKGTVTPKEPKGAILVASPDKGATGFGKLPEGKALEVVGKAAGFYKVELPEQARFAFVDVQTVKPGGTAPRKGPGFEDLLLHSPPSIKLSATLSVRGDEVTVKGQVHDGDGLMDAYMYVNSRKVYYHSNRKAKDPKSLVVDTKVKLQPGVNLIRFVARESDDVVSRKVLVVRRDGAGGEWLKSPKAHGPSFAAP